MKESSHRFTTSSRHIRTAPQDLPRADIEEHVAARFVQECQLALGRSRFFAVLASGAMTPALMRYVFTQYHHYRAQLHRWFALCILRIPTNVRPDQKEAIMALADHLFTDLKDGHDAMYDAFLASLGVPMGEPLPRESPTTRAYARSFLDDFGGDDGGEYAATVALAGRELVVALRNRGLIEHYFERRAIEVPTWIALHAELELEHFRDALRPALDAAAGTTDALDAIEAACSRTIARHIEYLDALLDEAEPVRANG